MIDPGSLLVSQITLGAASTYALQILKNASWFPLLEKESSRIVKVFFSVVAAVCSATGLHYIHDSAAHTLLIENFSLAMVLVALWHWAGQFAIQEGWYQLVFNKGGLVADEQALVVQQAKKIVSASEHELVGAGR